jgi:hypothetical protein
MEATLFQWASMRPREITPIKHQCFRRFAALLAFCAVLTSGCNQGPQEAEKPEVNGAAAAARALELYDANSDQALDQEEMAKCPPLASARDSYDVNKDGRLAADEIAARLDALAGPRSAFVGVTCAVSFSGRSLEGAVVKLRPVEMLAENLPPAEGTTDESGAASPTIAGDRLPPDLANASLVFPGLYHVEITHPQAKIPARYNTATELGWEIDPSSRTGTSARFDLKAN